MSDINRHRDLLDPTEVTASRDMRQLVDADLREKRDDSDPFAL